MSTAAAVEPRPTPEFRATIYYFIQYMSGAATTVYSGIWFAGQGLSTEQIGIINAVPTLIMLVLNILVGRIADRASDWKQVIVIGSVIAGITPLGLFFVHDFWGILTVWILLSLPSGLVGPVADAATLRMTRRRGSHFGTIRAWGTVGYMVMLVLVGMVIGWFGGGIFLPLFLFFSLARTAAAFGLPRFRASQDEKRESVHRPEAGAASRLGDAMRPFFILPLVGFSMVYGTHIVLNAFQGLLWKEQGLSEDIIGPLLAVAAITEAALMFAFARFGHKVSARTLILASALTSVFRWTCMALQPGIEWLIPLQGLNAITFALGYMGCMTFIANWTSDEIAAQAQGFFQMLQQVMSVICLTAFGWLMGFMGAQAYFVAAAFAALGAGLIWASIALHGRKRPGEARLG
ncbi:MAG: MFS transporter [Rubrivivax sp.]